MKFNYNSLHILTDIITNSAATNEHINSQQPRMKNMKQTGCSWNRNA